MARGAVVTALVVSLAVAIHGCEPGSGCMPLKPTTNYSKGDLTGLHLHITTVHDSAAMNMRDSDGNLLPSEQWTGFQRDVMDWVPFPPSHSLSPGSLTPA